MEMQLAYQEEPIVENLPAVLEQPKAPTIFFDFNDLANLPVEVLRDVIGELEVILKASPQIDLPVQHHFSPGVYGREIFMPKDSLVIGKIHKNQTMNVISMGEVSILSIDGVIRVKAPYTFVSSPGAKRVVYMHTDCVWSTFHGTHETDLVKIEDEFIAKTYDDVYISLENVQRLPEVSTEPQLQIDAVAKEEEL